MAEGNLLQERLADIDWALATIDDGRYGTCDRWSNQSETTGGKSAEALLSDLPDNHRRGVAGPTPPHTCKGMLVTSSHQNIFNQPVGFPVSGWKPPALPPRTPLEGRYCRVEALTATEHATALYTANTADSGRMWTYLGYGPFAGYGDYKAWVESVEQSTDHSLCHR
ncbi:MAG: hypothetical protein R2932_12945 [Caldilineaceae bacterium]